MSLYGSPLWNFQANDFSELEIAWRKSCRTILNINPRTHNNIIPQLMETPNIKSIVEERFLNQIINGVNHKNPLISNIYKNTLLESLPHYTSCLNIIMKNYNLKYFIIFMNKKIKFQRSVISWEISMIKELLYFRDFSKFDILNFDQINILLNYLCTK